MSLNSVELLAIAKIGWNLYYEDSDEEEEEEDRRNVEKNEEYFEEVIPRFDDKQFKVHFRLTRTSFQNLFHLVGNVHGRYSDMHPGQPEIDLEKQCLITLWYLSNLEVFRSIADRFGICIASSWRVVLKISKYLLTVNVENNIICWPNEESRQKTSMYFENRTKFPGVIGCIDGSHIAIVKPKLHPNSYINRKKFHSVLLQGVCNEKMEFIDCYAGEAGSIHDACLFRRSDLYRRISSGSVEINEDQHLLGDQAYGLKTYLLTRFKDFGNLNEGQKKYNEVHSSIRAAIERTFGLLKGRFRRLQQLHTRRPDLIPLTILAGCILHNFCLKSEDFLEESVEIDDVSNTDTPSNNVDLPADQKRNNIVGALMRY